MCSRVAEEVGIDCCRGNMSRLKREEAKESNRHQDSRERSNCLVVLLHSLKVRKLV